jgi:hypothetical protein
MQRTLANANECPACGSIDVTIQSFGMPTETFGHYMAAYEALSRAITIAALEFSPLAPLDVDLRDDDAFDEWFCPEEGRGFYAPGNHYESFGCIVSESDEESDEDCTCRSCGFTFSDSHDEDVDTDDEESSLVME